MIGVEYRVRYNPCAKVSSHTAVCIFVNCRPFRYEGKTLVSRISDENLIRPWLRALGADDLPAVLDIEGRQLHLNKTFKHDFFAVTGLYLGEADKVVLKVGRRATLFGLPMSWTGRFLANHEARLFHLMRGIPGVPAFRGWFGPTGILHDYVEGRPLQKEDTVSDDFFPKLSALIDAVHARGAAYVDLEKRENILLGDDGLPHLIDFQISWFVPANRGGEVWPFRMIRDILQASDKYHLIKHWRRLRPDQLAGSQIDGSYRPPFWIRWHRTIFRPLTLLRRQILVWLGARDSIKVRSPG